jgi:aminopeptidase-like protein
MNIQYLEQLKKELNVSYHDLIDQTIRNLEIINQEVKEQAFRNIIEPDLERQGVFHVLEATDKHTGYEFSIFNKTFELELGEVLCLCYGDNTITKVKYYD